MTKNGTIHERIEHLVKTLADGKNTVFAAKLGVSEANIRGYIKGVIPKADVLEKIVISYEVNAMWLLTGTGYETLPNQPEDVPSPLTDQSLLTDFFKTYEPYIQRKDAKIIQQAEEIGQLKEQIRQLTFEKEKLVTNVHSSTTANVG